MIEELVYKICTVIGEDPDKKIKRPIRGLPGITVFSLIEALLVAGTLNKAAEYLGYTTNPVKQAIKEVLIPTFSTRHKEYGSGGGLTPWKYELLKCINYKCCGQCNRILPHSEYYSNTSRIVDGLASFCKSCNIAASKSHKYYIVQRTPSWSELDLIAEFYRNCPIGYHVDHILPLRGNNVSGLHVLSNLQYLSATENMKKGNKFSIE